MTISLLGGDVYCNASHALYLDAPSGYLLVDQYITYHANQTSFPIYVKFADPYHNSVYTVTATVCTAQEF